MSTDGSERTGSDAGLPPTWLRTTVVVLASLMLGSWLLVALARVDDSFGTLGPWTGLAYYAANGVLYPPLFDGAHFGGTRYMPLQFLLYAGSSKVTGEYLVSSKAVVALLAAGVLAILYVTLRRLGCSRSIALGAMGATLATAAVLRASLLVQGDSLALLAQLVALAVVARRPSRASALAAGCLCAVALLSKLTAIWAPIAIAIWLASRFRSRLPVFLASYIGTVGAGLAAIHVLSDGRALENRFLVSSGTWPGIHAIGVGLPRKLATLMMDDAGAIWLLVPLALLGFILAIRDRDVTVYHVSAPVALLVTLVVLSDPGAGANHIVDLSVLVAIVAAELETRAGNARPPVPLVTSALLCALAIGITVGYLTQMGPHLGGSLRGLAFGTADPEFPATPLAGHVRRDETVLAEDASISVARDQAPTILDAYMLLRILEERPEWRRALVRRIDARQFDKVVLLEQPLDPNNPYYSEFYFGEEVVSAIARNYRFETHADPWYRIYVPRSSPARAPP